MPPTDSRALEAAAKAISACMDYPWEFMPEQGRNTMRQHAKTVIDAALSAAPQSDGWRPIAEAPKDGTSVLVNDTTGLCPPCMSHWLEGEEWTGWVYDEELANDSNPLGPQPTHFMRIGPIPTTQTKGQSHGE